jgi:F-type H+-transporting ATPase subunit delta
MTARAAATRYARALFDVALKEGSDLAAIERELSDAAALVGSNEGLQRALSNPAIPAPRKRAVMEQLLAKSPVRPVLAKLLLLLADRDRLILLGEVAAAFRQRMMEHQNVVRAEVTTAVPLGPERVAAMQQGLAQATGRQVLLEARVDPAIIGGAVARIGSTVYDGSVTTQLERLRQQLIEAEAG